LAEPELDRREAAIELAELLRRFLAMSHELT
jgi:hypothetical protein